MRLLILDNYDSFTYNLYQSFGQINPEIKVDVVKSNRISISQIASNNYDKIVISPGPGSPDSPEYFGICGAVLTNLSQIIPTLGVCLGMQGLCHFYGGQIIRANKPMHGKISLIQHNQTKLFANLPQNLEVMRYHSLVANPENLPEILEVSATTDTGEIMGLNHKQYPIYGIQFHPESFATEGGLQILQNFLQI